eukprot:24163-Pelagococcus_subviridis.AAC.1
MRFLLLLLRRRRYRRYRRERRHRRGGFDVHRRQRRGRRRHRRQRRKHARPLALAQTERVQERERVLAVPLDRRAVAVREPALPVRVVERRAVRRPRRRRARLSPRLRRRRREIGRLRRHPALVLLDVVPLQREPRAHDDVHAEEDVEHVLVRRGISAAGPHGGGGGDDGDDDDGDDDDDGASLAS